MISIFITEDKRNIKIFCGEKVENVIDIYLYNNILDNSESDKYKIFDRIINNYGIKRRNEIEKNFLYLFNFILVNNLTNFLLDKAKKNNINEIVFDENVKKSNKEIIKLSSRLDTEDIIGDLMICLINSEEYLDGKIKISYGNFDKYNKEVYELNIIDIFNYRTYKVREYSKKLIEDLIAFKFIEKDNLSENMSYKLPIYINEESLKEKGIEEYLEFLPNWTSLAYLHMLEKIYNYFVDYYKLDYEKGLNNNELLLALIEILDYEIKDYPKGLKKSIEVGRSTSGKCYFIDSYVRPISISQELALVLQSKDAFGVVPRVFRNN